MRVDWTYIIVINVERSLNFRPGRIQSIGWINRRIIRLKDQKRRGYELNKELVAGSNVEKMSIIIQDLAMPCFSLKANSLQI